MRNNNFLPKETVLRIIDSPRTKEQMVDMIKGIPEVEAVEIKEGMTNGDMINAMFGIADDDIDEGLSTTYVYTKTRVLKGGSQDHLRERITFNRDWWNAPYKRESEDKE